MNVARAGTRARYDLLHRLRLCFENLIKRLFLKFSNFLNWLKSFRSKIHYKIEMRKYLKTRMKGAL